MVNSVLPFFNFFLGLLQAIPVPVFAFMKWTLGAFLVLLIYSILKEWLA